MPLTAYIPRDRERYRRHERSVPFSASVAAGVSVYVQDCEGVVWFGPDGPHMHPRVLGGARPAVAAGEMTLGANGEVLSINNLSGTLSVRSRQLARSGRRNHRPRRKVLSRRDHSI